MGILNNNYNNNKRHVPIKYFHVKSVTESEGNAEVI